MAFHKVQQIHNEGEPDDKDVRHKRMEKYDADRAKRARRLFHWSLDMPPDPDDMDVRVHKTNSGFGWRELAVIGLTAIGAGYLFTNRAVVFPPPTPPAPVAPVNPADSEYDVRFYDRDGNLIDIPRKPVDLGGE